MKPSRLSKRFFVIRKRVLDMAGPPLYDTKSVKSKKGSRNSHLDLLKLLLDGIVESSHSNESTVCHTSVACIAALLDSLEDISQGKALSDLHIMEINKHLESINLQDEQPVLAVNQPEPTEKLEDSTKVVNNGIIVETAEQEEDNVTMDDGKVVTLKDNKSEEDGAGNEVDNADDRDVVHSSDDENMEKSVTDAAGKISSGDNEVTAESVKPVEVASVNGEGSGKTNVDAGSSENIATYQVDVTGKELCDIKPLEDKVIESFDETQASEDSRTQEIHLSDRHDIESHQLNQGDQTSETDKTSSEDKQQNGEVEDEQKESVDEEMRKKQITAELEMEKQRAQRREELEKIAKMNAEAEREGARDFVNQLIALLPSLIPLIDTMEVDQSILKFAARFCAVEARRRKTAMENDGSSNSPVKQPSMPILNADGIYVATYAALLLNLKLVKTGHYNQATTIPISENEFIRRVHDGVFLVYLSSTWLTELYNQVVDRDLLGEAGYCHKSVDCNNALITLLTDIDGLGNRNIGGQMLQGTTSHNALGVTRNIESQEEAVEAGIKFAKMTLVTIWDQVLEVLSVPLATKNITVVGSIAFLLGTEGAKEQNSRDRDAIMMSLDGLRKAARLSCTLGVQDRCATVLAQLANASCVYADPTVQPTDPKKQSLRSRIATANKTGVRLHTSHVLSMDALLNMGLEIGSHSPESWRHVFRCCAYVSQLEHSHFSSGNTQTSVSITRVQEHQQSDSHGVYDGLNNDLDMMSPYTQQCPHPYSRQWISMR
ncbi:brefeldin A-inhibited guanine nucleotide-exchange protein 3-like isoform X2 [Ptychodera flava]|uniref:brefeldin A-inhibited guanine nucleotide-exchange protein 3-like isoform X2 n=1 Tax=Ptychodera flava TaxID=63121 RepID=UPI00396A95B5